MQQAGAFSKNVRELIVVCDEAGLIRFVSQSFAGFFGAPAQSWHGRAFAPGGGAAEPGSPASYRTEAHSAGRAFIVDWTETVLSGGERLYVGAPDGVERGGPASSSVYEVIAEARAQAAEGETDPKLQLLATMSHEMRTPLNGILGMTSLLLDTGLEPNQRAYAESVRESGVALLALINDLLDYSKIEAGRLDIEQAAFSPLNMIQSVAELLSPKAADKGIEITAYVDSAVPAELFGDEARLRQVLINLAGNGVKFTDTGGVAIEARLVSAENGAAQVAFSVRDTGVGISEGKLASIFEEFSQGDSVGERKREGTGLGLAIARKIVRAMDGEISLESKLGEGSTFTFNVSLGFDGKAPARPRPFTTPVIVATRSTVLARCLELQLAAIGAENVLSVSTPAGALDAMAKHPNAMLLCDIYIAGESAQPLARKAVQSYVLLSPMARGRINELREAGFNGYFIKPIRQSSLHKQLTDDETETPAPQAQTPATASPAPSQNKTYRVLLAEDNQINAVLATTIIKRAGHSVEVAQNGAEAVDAVMLAEYDIILMDMHMPEVDGLEATRRIRRLDGPMRRAPIIALTANAMAADRQKCIAAGMDDFLSKPFEPSDLTSLLAKWGECKSEWSEAS
ncbi:response regulator [Hyphococcus sp.]|uniref:response regulator n=1 Tax=Hyphococcus sp. TaxID=2038636 RepID=UPI002082FF2E|nr:MAG: hypothetical protein DHS20C04_03030 [Marinicaulis sp.]